MRNDEQYIITVRYPEWEQTFDGKTHKYKPFAVRYLLVTGIHQDPDWAYDDKRWLQYDPTDAIKDDFIEWYKSNIGKDFNGEILFVEPCDYVIAAPKDKE